MPKPEPRAAPWAEVVPLGRVHEVACAVTAAHLGTLMGFKTRIADPEPVPGSAYLEVRGQYNAAALIDYLAQDLPPGIIRVGVTEADICLPVFTHVFGEARMAGGVAVTSLYRLRRDASGQTASREIVYQRLAKVVCHEVGHAMGLSHCFELGCLMRFAGDLATLDGLEMWFCPACGQELDRRRAEVRFRQR